MKGTDLLIETYRSFATPPRLYTNINSSRSYTAGAEVRTDADGTLQIDLSAYAEGTYLLRVGDNAQRLLIQR